MNAPENSEIFNLKNTTYYSIVLESLICKNLTKHKLLEKNIKRYFNFNSKVNQLRIEYINT